MAVREVKLCLLGESGVGKSSLATRFVHDAFRGALEATIGAAFLTKSIDIDGQSIKFQIWDTAGQEKYRALAPMYYRGAAAAIVVYDITSQESFDTLKSWINELRKHGPVNLVLAIAGNKCDLENLREVQYKEALAYAESVGAVFVETSAKTAVNVSALFYEIGKRLPKHDLEKSYESFGETSIRLRNAPNHGKKKKKCC